MSDNSATIMDMVEKSGRAMKEGAEKSRRGEGFEDLRLPYLYAQFDPRPTPEARAANDAIFASHPVLGIEVTEETLANRCILGNLDHHRPGDTAETPSACEQALTTRDAPSGLATLATIRPDADSVTAMAVLASRRSGTPIDEKLIGMIGEMDRRGPIVGDLDPRVVAISRIAFDAKRPLGQRVEWIQKVLAGEQDTAKIDRLVAERDAELAAAEKESDMKLEADGRIAVVISTNRFATNLGYRKASTVVAMNPEMPVDFRDASKGTYRKYTVCRYDSHVSVDLESALKELQTREPGWGGRGDIFGSPQGVSSALSVDEVVETIKRHLK